MKIADCKHCQEIGDVHEGVRSEREWDLIWLHRGLKHKDELFRERFILTGPMAGMTADQQVDYMVKNLKAKLGDL